MSPTLSLHTHAPTPASSEGLGASVGKSGCKPWPVGLFLCALSLKVDTFISMCLTYVSVSHKVLNTEGLRAALCWHIQSPQIKTLSNSAIVEFKNQWITQRNYFSRRLNSPGTLEQELSSAVRKGATFPRRGCSLRALHVGQQGHRDTSQGAEVGRRTSPQSPCVWGVKWWQEPWAGIQKTCIEVPPLIRCAAFTILSLSFHTCKEHKYYSHLPCRVTVRNISGMWMFMYTGKHDKNIR